MAGVGNGAQRLMIAPHHAHVVVVPAGNYNPPDAWQLPVAVVTEILLPALQER
jgi:hypothetical protein